MKIASYALCAALAVATMTSQPAPALAQQGDPLLSNLLWLLQGDQPAQRDWNDDNDDDEDEDDDRDDNDRGSRDDDDSDDSDDDGDGDDD
jgi:hypothetical protein